MPMDPYFRDSMRGQRRHNLTVAWETVRGWLPRRRRKSGDFAVVAGTPAARRLAKAVPEIAAPVTPGAPLTSSATDAPAQPPKPAKPAKGTPAWEQRNSRLWDKKLQGRVGIDGPELATSEHHIPVPGFPDVRVRLYLPDTAASADPLPALLYFFGGAFHVGGIDYASIDANNRRRVADSGVAILAVDYALAPDHRFPTPVEQGYAALDWMVTHAGELGLDPNRLGIGGMSSGGNIAAAVTLANRARAGHDLRLQILEVPVVDLTGKTVDFAAMRKLGVPGFAARYGMAKIRSRYLGHRDQALSELASPLRARDLSGLPDAYIFTAEFDALRTNGDAYAHALRQAGVEASCVQYQGIVHEAPMFTAVIPAARRWHRDIVATLRILHEDS